MRHDTTQVISGSKFILKKEWSTRDHVDLLLSPKHWPLSHARIWRAMLWGDRRECFEKNRERKMPKSLLYYKIKERI